MNNTRNNDEVNKGSACNRFDHPVDNPCNIGLTALNRLRNDFVVSASTVLIIAVHSKEGQSVASVN